MLQDRLPLLDTMVNTGQDNVVFATPARPVTNTLSSAIPGNDQDGGQADSSKALAPTLPQLDGTVDEADNESDSAGGSYKAGPHAGRIEGTETIQVADSVAKKCDLANVADVCFDVVITLSVIVDSCLTIRLQIRFDHFMAIAVSVASSLGENLLTT